MIQGRCIPVLHSTELISLRQAILLLSIVLRRSYCCNYTSTPVVPLRYAISGRAQSATEQGEADEKFL
jgi:hypothetical protein